MSVYFFKALRGGGLPKDRGEIIQITIEYQDFIVDSQRISIERSIEAHFCSWLSAILSDADRASRVIGDDLNDFRVAVFGGLLLDLPESDLEVLFTPGMGIRVAPTFVLYDISEGSIRKNVGIALVATWGFLSQPVPAAIIGAAAATAMTAAVDEFKHPHVVEPPQTQPAMPPQKVINGALICTKQT